MSFMKRWRRWSARLVRVGCLASALAVTPGAVRSQELGGAEGMKMPPKHFTNKTSFHLPIQMTPATRGDTREICLYVKQAGSDWVKVESAPPTASHFTPKVSRDGEFWFTLVTITKSGKSTPPDVAKAPPGLRVVVDTTAPILDVQPAALDGEFSIRCIGNDANFDPATLKAFCRTEKGDRALELVPGQAGVFRVRNADLVYPVKVTAADLAGNAASRDVNIREMVMASMKPDEKLSHASHKVGTPGAVSPGMVGSVPPVLPPGLVEVPSTSPRSDTGAPGVFPPGLPGTVGSTLPPPGTLTPPSFPPTALPGVPATPSKGLTEVPGRLELPGTPPGGLPGTLPGALPTTLDKTGVPRQLLNTPQVSLDYRIDSVGPSGISRVDVYLTTDNAQSWKKVRDDADRRSPAEIELPGEGLFGVKLVLTNGNGFGGAAPARGEQPTCWVEVDTTSPHVTMHPIEPIAQNGILELRWAAADANLGAEPVNLYFRPRADAPWQPIARNLKNDGLYRWAFPRDMGGQFFLKTEVVDLAGNIARAETGPVVLDMTEPRASVLNISSVGVRATPPLGN